MQQIEERCVRSGNVEDDDARGLGGAAIVAHHLDIGRFDQSLARLDRYGRAALQYQREGALQHVDGYGKTMGVPDRLVTRLEVAVMILTDCCSSRGMPLTTSSSTRLGLAMPGAWARAGASDVKPATANSKHQRLSIHVLPGMK